MLFATPGRRKSDEGEERKHNADQMKTLRAWSQGIDIVCSVIYTNTAMKSDFLLPENKRETFHK